MPRLVPLSKLITLDVLGGDEPPAAFRLFRAGENETTKGVFLFDEKSAEMVMAAAKDRGGVDYPIDLEHLSLESSSDSRNYDPDARGWFALEVRGGELWAVNVRWTPDGCRRLSEKTQRYVSPAFMTDDDNRITEIVNVALVAMPATHGTPALVAANRRPRMTVKEQINALMARLSIARGKLTKLAEGEGGDGAAPGKGAAVKSACDKAVAACEELQKAFGGGDIDAVFAAMDAAKVAMQECESAIDAMAGAPAAAPPPAEMAAEPAKDEKQAEAAARKEAEIVSLRKELAARKEADAKREHEAKVAKLAAEMDERRTICASLVTDRGVRPADVWADETASSPKGVYASMSIEDLRTLAKSLGVSVKLGGPKPPRKGGEMDIIGGTAASLVTEEEVSYVRARHAMLTAVGNKLRSVDETIIRYQRHKQQQLNGAEHKKDDAQIALLTKPLEKRVVMLASRAGLVMLASTPVTPYEEFGASSQAALQSFRLEYNIALASMIPAWAETVGQMLADGSMKTTYPVTFDATQYREKTGPNAEAVQSMSADIEVKQREFYGAKQVELRRLKQGDFAYVQRWAQNAAELARARVFLRNEIVTTILEANATWGVTAAQASGIDGQAFFSATHKVNPFDATKKLRGSATYSNYQAAAKPLTAANLTAEKNTALQIAAPDGRELGVIFDGLLYPSALQETAYNLLRVQDIILDAAATLNSVNNVFAGTRNPHKDSGLEMTRASELAGTDTTADYYLYSREAIARGLVPWVIAEDPNEEIRLWDETSDFYKNSGHIKIESHVFVNAALLYPHAIRKIKGS